jgi:hypothetical protein
VTLHVHSVQVSYKGKVAAVLDEYKTGLLARSCGSGLLDSKKNPQLQRHVETWKICMRAQFGAR